MKPGPKTRKVKTQRSKTGSWCSERWWRRKRGEEMSVQKPQLAAAACSKAERGGRQSRILSVKSLGDLTGWLLSLSTAVAYLTASHGDLAKPSSSLTMRCDWVCQDIGGHWTLRQQAQEMARKWQAERRGCNDIREEIC